MIDPGRAAGNDVPGVWGRRKWVDQFLPLAIVDTKMQADGDQEAGAMPDNTRHRTSRSMTPDVDCAHWISADGGEGGRWERVCRRKNRARGSPRLDR